MKVIQSIGFIGAGRVTRILLEGLRRQSALPPEVRVFDCHQEPIQALQARVPEARSVQTAGEAAGAEVVFLAVHPPAMPDAAAGIKNSLTENTVVVSLAPKWKLEKVTELLGGFNRVVRLIPNAPSLIGAGYNPVAFAAGLPAEERERVLSLLRPLGECPEVPENQLEAYAVVAAMGPTYFWFQWQVLRELAGDFGLSPDAADAALRAMVNGALRTLLEAGLSPVEVMDLVPVKPLAELEATISEGYRTRLTAIYQKIAG